MLRTSARLRDRPCVSTDQGAKLLVLIDHSDLPLGVLVEAAPVAESQLLERTLAAVAVPRAGAGRPRWKPVRRVADRGYDIRVVWERLKRQGIDLTVPHLRLRRRRWQASMTISRWI